jgi:predicted nucleic acid-binding protein
LDTSVVIDLPRIDVAALPAELAISSITLAELAAGPHAAVDATEQAVRQQRLAAPPPRISPAAG